MRRTKVNFPRPAETVEEILAAAGQVMQARRRPFDDAAGLRRLARDSGRAAPAKPSVVTRARHQLSVMTYLYLNERDAPGHVEEFAARLGDDGKGNHHPPFEDLDVHGAQLFGCMLHMAGHPHSAQFWWELAAGADHIGAVYCLYLHHLGQGASAEAGHWLDQLRLQHADIDEVFLLGTARFTQWMHDHRPLAAHPDLVEEVVRLALHDDGDQFLVCRPERQIADRLHHPGRGA
ncbi:hypothetical protein ABZ864_40900 [Streptomyces sp. NPDC047082]|uniref:hypothetical protein n=1 Tax=Streptomyces sp. NPDC047082 TaxID=3155259 RepID=UPI0034068F16